MKSWFLGILSLLTFSGAIFAETHHGASHSTEGAVTYTLATGSDALSSGPITLRLQLKNNKGKVLAFEDIVLSHTQKIHAFLVDSTLTQFRHEHPEWDGKDWILKTELSSGGDYKLWIQARVAGSGDTVTLSKSISVKGPSAPNQKFSENFSGESDGIAVKLSPLKAKAGDQATLKFTVSRKDGSNPSLEKYLGAAAHVVAIREGNDVMAHMHPLNEEAGSPFETHAAFEKPGFYRIWAQFLESGKLRTVPFTLQVAKVAAGKMQMDHSKH